MLDRSTSPEPLDQLQAGLFMLLNDYAGQPCCCTAHGIARQLERILRHPLIDLFPELQRQYARCLNNWRVRAGFEPVDAKAGGGHHVH